MHCYIISYDLHNSDGYKDLYAAFKSYRTWARITESTWAVVSDEEATEIFDHLRQFIGKDDRLFIVRSGTESAWMNVRCRDIWLKKHL